MILSVAGTPIRSFTELRDRVGASEGKPLAVEVWRAGRTLDAVLAPKRVDVPDRNGGFETRWLIGLSGDIVFTPQTRTPGPVEAAGLAARETWPSCAPACRASGT